jgi:coenzyme F420 hydrogenase subunit beta
LDPPESVSPYRPFDFDTTPFIDYTDHVDNYGGVRNPHEADH